MSNISKPANQSSIVNMAARASARRRVFQINEEMKNEIPEKESKYESDNDYQPSEEDDDSSSDYQPSEEDDDSSSDYQPSEDEDKMETDDDSSSDYQPSEDEEMADDETLNEEDSFDIKVFNILSGLKYNVETSNKYLFNWGMEYCNMLESEGDVFLKNKNEKTIKRNIKNAKKWKKILKEVQHQVFMNRLN